MLTHVHRFVVISALALQILAERSRSTSQRPERQRERTAIGPHSTFTMSNHSGDYQAVKPNLLQTTCNAATKGSER